MKINVIPVEMWVEYFLKMRGEGSPWAVKEEDGEAVIYCGGTKKGVLSPELDYYQGYQITINKRALSARIFVGYPAEIAKLKTLYENYEINATVALEEIVDFLSPRKES